MTAQTGQIPFAFASADKTNLRTQIAALCYRRKKGKLQFLLVTTRTSRRWIVPKGWPMAGLSAQQVAATEAWEEAGVRGIVHERPVGVFSYTKEYDNTPDLPCAAIVYGVKVEQVEKDFPEREERERRWVSRKKALAMVELPELVPLMRAFDPASVDWS